MCLVDYEFVAWNHPFFADDFVVKLSFINVCVLRSIPVFPSIVGYKNKVFESNIICMFFEMLTKLLLFLILYHSLDGIRYEHRGDTSPWCICVSVSVYMCQSIFSYNRTTRTRGQIFFGFDTLINTLMHGKMFEAGQKARLLVVCTSYKRLAIRLIGWKF